MVKRDPLKGAYWGAPGARVVRALGMAPSFIAGKPIGMGQHGAADLTRH